MYLQSLPLTEEGSDTTGTLERVPSDCVHCAIEKGLASEDKSETDLSIETGVSHVIIFRFHNMMALERSGSVVECLTQDQEAAS